MRRLPVKVKEAVIEMVTQDTTTKLRELALTGMLKASRAQQTDPAVQALAFDDRFGLLVDPEGTLRQQRRQDRWLKAAPWRLAAAPEAVACQTPRGLDPGMVRALFTSEWVARHQNVVIVGPTGVGKTFLACALGTAACRQGQATRYYRLPRLLTELAVAAGDGSAPRLLTALAQGDLLILDACGLADLSTKQGRDLLAVIDDRAGHRSTVVARPWPLDRWHGVIEDATVADAWLDRLIHHAHKIVLQGDSRRKRSVP